jgi:hypothetical protein
MTRNQFFSQGREVILPSIWRTFPLAWRQDTIHVNCEAKVALALEILRLTLIEA